MGIKIFNLQSVVQHICPDPIIIGKIWRHFFNIRQFLTGFQRRTICIPAMGFTGAIPERERLVFLLMIVEINKISGVICGGHFFCWRLSFNTAPFPTTKLTCFSVNFSGVARPPTLARKTRKVSKIL